MPRTDAPPARGHQSRGVARFGQLEPEALRRRLVRMAMVWLSLDVVLRQSWSQEDKAGYAFDSYRALARVLKGSHDGAHVDPGDFERWFGRDLPVEVLRGRLSRAADEVGLAIQESGLAADPARRTAIARRTRDRLRRLIRGS